MRRKILITVLTLTISIARVVHAYDTDEDAFRPEVFACEVALATLEACCPGFDPERVYSTYRKEYTTGCDFHTTITTRPALNDLESRCVEASSCEDLRARHVCERAQTAVDYVNVERTPLDSPVAWRAPSSHDPVCP